jgi:hypothetical protein
MCPWRGKAWPVGQQGGQEEHDRRGDTGPRPGTPDEGFVTDVPTPGRGKATGRK